MPGALLEVALTERFTIQGATALEQASMKGAQWGHRKDGTVEQRALRKCE